jgi:5-(carboxyamino)imidazole ribonucleotide synthase
VLPDIRVLELTNDRLREKQFVTDLGIETTEFVKIDSLDDLARAVDAIGTPAILKTRRFGYDGKGQTRIENAGECGRAWRAISQVPAILERFVRFDKELSVILARARTGEIKLYDVAENVHDRHILASTRVPARIETATGDKATAMACKIADAFDYVGVMAVELFLETGGGEIRLRVNEIAPRVHNSGHWTLDAAMTCQFEQHIRAVSGWPLGDPSRLANAVMTNLIGTDVDNWRHYAQDPAVKLHIYGKTKTMPGRKMGHVTRLERLQT